MEWISIDKKCFKEEIMPSIYEKMCCADEVTHHNCKYSVDRSLCGHTCKRIEDNGYGYDDFECSKCGWVVWGFLMEHEGEGVVSQPRYCPNCGAKVIRSRYGT